MGDQVTQGGTFEGFSPETFSFFAEMHENNSTEFWEDNRERYERLVRGPLEELGGELVAEFGTATIPRAHRDLRFTRDQRPLQERAALVVGNEQVPSLYFQINAEGAYIAAGLYGPDRHQLAAFRDALDDPHRAAEFRALVRRLSAAGYPLRDGDPLKTAPRGWSTDHPEIEFLRLRRISVGRHIDPCPGLHSRQALHMLESGWRHVRELTDWLGHQLARQPARA